MCNKIFRRVMGCLMGLLLLFVMVFAGTSMQMFFGVKASAASVGTGYVANVEDGGIYYIKNQRSGLYLSVSGNSTASGAALIQSDYSGYAYQQFRLTKYTETSGVYYKFTPMNTAYLSTPKVLKVENNSAVNNADIQLALSGAASGEKFRLVRSACGDNSFVIKTGSTSYSKCITVKNASKDTGAGIIQYTYEYHGNTDNDHWYFEEVPSFGGTYYIRNQKSGRYFDILGNNTSNGTKVVQYDYTGSISQQIKIEPHSMGGYTFTSVLAATEKSDYTSIEIAGGSLTNNTSIQLGEENAAQSRQRFNIVPTGNGDGAFKIMAFGDGTNSKCMAVSQASNENEAAIILFDYSNHGSSDNDHWYLENITPLNQKQVITLSNSTQTAIEMICPDNRLYTVETFAYGSVNADPVVSVEGLSGVTIMDDNSGTENHAKLPFKGEKGKTIRIKIWTHNTPGVKCYIQLRKQKAIFVGGKYDDLDTSEGLNVPYDKLFGLYDAYQYGVEPRTTTFYFLTMDERKMPRYNSEVVFFFGHGAENQVKFPFGSRLYGIDLENMNNTKVVIWLGCKTAVLDALGRSMVTSSISAGAQSALGFNQIIYDDDALKFSNKLFSELAAGKTISAAANSAKNLFWLPPSVNTVKDYTIGGDGNTVITTPTGEQMQNMSLSAPAVINYSAFDSSLLTHFISACTYETENYGNGEIRYYKTIDGIRTNQYIDVVDGEIVSTNYAPGNDEKSVLSVLTQTKASDLGKLSSLYGTQAVESYQVYFFDEETYIPVELNYIISESGTIEDVVCINLHTGEGIDYNDIAYLEE